MMSLFLRKRKNHEKAERESFTIRNGKTLLEKLVGSSNGKYNPIRSFSAEELKRATNNYHYGNVITDRLHYKLYRGFLQDRPISVMKFLDDNCFLDPYVCCFNNIVFASQMSHRNVLKLIGCSLEVQIPILVFEPIEYGTLCGLLYGWDQPHSHIEPLQLKHRLKIAMEIANVLAYLHIGFSRPIVFRDLTRSHILFCEQYVPKLFNFWLAASIPEGQTHIEDAVMGTSGTGAPEYVATGFFNEKCDVYNFGDLLFQIVTGEELMTVARRPEIPDGQLSYVDLVKKYIEIHGFNEIVDPRIIGDELLEQQLRASIDLAFSCLCRLAEDRPAMVDVAKQLRQMYQSI